MRATASMLVCLGMLTAVLFVVPDGVLAEPAAQELSPETMLTNDFDLYGSSTAAAILANRTEDLNMYNLDPGFLAWEATDTYDGQHGTARLAATLTDPTGELAEYYNVRVYVRSLIFDSDGGVDFLQSRTYATLGIGLYGTGFETYWPTERGILEYYDPSGASWYNTLALEALDWMNPYVPELGRNIILLYHDFDEHPVYERPWSLAEVQNMYVWGEFGWEPSIMDYLAYFTAPLYLAVAQLYVEITPADYDEPVIPSGSFVLRPDSDLSSENMINESGNASPLYAALDETTRASDENITYIYPSSTLFGYAEFGFSNPPSWASDTTYTLYPWLIMQADADIGSGNNDLTFLHWWIGPAHYPSPEWYDIDEDKIRTYFTNTTEVATDYGGTNYTLADLYVMTGGVNLDELLGDQVNISQFAILCVPGVYVPVVDEDDAEGGIFGWVMSGGGILGIFGMLGFFGMVATMVISAYSFREGGGYESLTGGFMLFMVFLALFLAAVFAAG